MAAFHYQSAYYNAYNPTSQAMNMGDDQNAAIFGGYVHAGYFLMYYQYWVPFYYLQYQLQPYCHDHSWMILQNNAHHQEEEHEYHQFMPCDESFIPNAHEENDEVELNEEELREWDLLEGELVFYDANDDDDDVGLSEETVAKHLKTRDCFSRQNQHCCGNDDDDDKICVVCQDCLVQEDEKIASLDCGHEFHAMCIKSWLMLKNCCPLCKATGIIC